MIIQYYNIQYFMTTIMEKELMNEVYDSVLITAGLILISMVSKKILRENIISAENVKSYAKLAGGIAGSTLAVKYLQKKKYLPVDPFSSKK